MDLIALLLAALVHAGAANHHDQSPRTTPPRTAGVLDASAESSERPDQRCLSALSSAEVVHPGRALSAFKLFNEYPPSRESIPPEDVELTSFQPQAAGLISCVEESHFPFSILVDGVLTEGTTSQIHPVTAWRTPQGYLAFFLHENYETVDGEGETIDMSALALDISGRPIQLLRAVSSWYEYEGSIRIRDFVYSDHRVLTTEEIFDPLERDESGNVLTYEDARSGTTSIREIDWTSAKK